MNIIRKFKFEGEMIEDPDPSLTVKQAVKSLGLQYPELLNGSIQDKGIQFEDNNEYILYELSTSIGVKG